MKPALVILRVGPGPLPASLAALLGSAGIDVALSWDGPAAPALPGAVFVDAAVGPRWPALARAVAVHADRVACYSHVWMPDAAVQCTPDAVAQLFAVCADLGLELAQPAFEPTPDGVHPLARRHAGFQLRFTNTVDAAAPLFAQALLQRVLPTLAHGGGRGAGFAWARCARLGRVAVVDATPVALARAGAVEPGDDIAAAHFGAADDAPLNAGGLLDSGDALCLGDAEADDALLAELARGCAGVGTAALVRYLAPHLSGGVPRRAIRAALEREHAEVGIVFNRRAAAADPAPLLDTAARLALCEADLRDLRSRHAALTAERDRQAETLAAVAATLAAACEQRPAEALAA